MMRTANPALSDNTFKNAGHVANKADRMTINGTVNKTGILLMLTLLSAAWVWTESMPTEEQMMMGTFSPSPLVFIGAIGGLITAIVTIFKKEWAPMTAPIYAVLEGMFLGGISAVFEVMYPGIVIQAITATFGTLFALLSAYRSGLIKVTENFRLGVVAATGGIALLYLLSFIMGFFGAEIPFIHESGLLGIGFSVFVVIIAALNLVLDFDFIEHGEEAGAPKYMEWYAGFGLLVTLVWLYIEFLRLLAKLRD